MRGLVQTSIIGLAVYAGLAAVIIPAPPPAALALLAAFASLVAPSADAHHSRTNFIMDSPMELEGTITEHAYHNPHIYLTLETADAATVETREWLLEANAVSSVRSVGWRADTFLVGDRVSVRGFPHREPDRGTLFVDVITKADGSSYRSSGLAPGSFRAPDAPARGSTDFSGVWQPDFAARNVAAGFRPDSLPLTPGAQAVLDGFDPDDDPALDCIPESLPATVLPVYPVRFSRVGEDELHIWYEQFDGAPRRPPGDERTSRRHRTQLHGPLHRPVRGRRAGDRHPRFRGNRVGPGPRHAQRDAEAPGGALHALGRRPAPGR